VGALTEGLRMELRRDGVHAMLVCPGYVKTRFQEHARGGRVPSDVLRSRRYAITAERCAAAIRRGVERDARTVLTPRAGWILVALARLLPSIVQARMAGMSETGTA
jgi:short-subunit dehydrogenase